jgi:hypothetical protein
MEEIQLGQGTIVYEDPKDGRTETTVDNEELVYARDHWMLRSGGDEHGNDQMRQIPRDRVYYVERNVERFEERAATVRHRVESLASNLREKVPVDMGDGGSRRERSAREETEPTRIPVEKSDEE